MPCSAITLSLATVAGVVAVTLLGIAFGTDNWVYIRVDRKQIQEDMASGVGTLSAADQERFESEAIYRSRTQGLFRTCFPESRPKGVDLYLSPVETYCENINYYIPDEENLTKTFSEELMARLHMARSMIALFIVAFFFIFVAFWTGVVGCWRRSAGNIGTTAALMLFACLFSAGAMGLWHGVQYFEQKKLNEEPYYRSWPPLAKKYTDADVDWSFYLAVGRRGLDLLELLVSRYRFDHSAKRTPEAGGAGAVRHVSVPDKVVQRRLRPRLRLQHLQLPWPVLRLTVRRLQLLTWVDASCRH
ncbi:voltage-dependent calcium channel gamma-5 subunit-like isoform X1 [Pollicipes pollicipes]|uniref:voltage-dependent calcium channel gamma-5 subunit-like isoform X1 n=1 Tax=Pollicipes pollicipes TaxID=41117 RepID=UPI0018851146|nr:voltage-dependent calcium channel gamma-5 subunit-like isoform X1 [Pollicipes pollicipes]